LSFKRNVSAFRVDIEDATMKYALRNYKHWNHSIETEYVLWGRFYT